MVSSMLILIKATVYFLFTVKIRKVKCCISEQRFVQGKHFYFNFTSGVVSSIIGGREGAYSCSF